MNAAQPEIEVKNIDHLGIIAGTIDELGLVEEVNQHLSTHPQEKVSAGQVLKAMIINGLGFVAAPLYLFEQFFVGKATEHLIGEGVKPEHLNDDRLGRVLDKCYQFGVTQLFSQVAMKAAKQFGVSLSSSHLDSSSFHVDGEYAQPEVEAGAQGESHPSADSEINHQSEPTAISITYGYSRDHRPDLKQFIVDTICSGDGDVPLYLRVADGNEADKAVFAQVMKEFRQQWDCESLQVVDAAFYTAENLESAKQLRWLSRVPLTLKQAQQVRAGVQEEEWQPSQQVGYRWVERQIEYAGIAQRWFVIESEKRKQADVNQIERQIDRQQQQQALKLRQLCRQDFACETDARAAAARFERTLRYHRLQKLNLVSRPHYSKGGRPRKDEQPSHFTYRIQAQLQPHSEAIAAALAEAGRFILATNVLPAKELSADEALQEYKDQQSSERGFRFLKDPLFFTSSVFVKSPKRVMALVMVMGLSLLIYSLAQRQLRQALQAADDGIPNQKGKLTDRPTLRWIFQCFQAVHLVRLNGTRQISNLNDLRIKILRFLGAACGRYYLLC